MRSAEGSVADGRFRWSWDKNDAFLTDRAYDYVHVVAAYWAMYRVARNYPSLTSTRTWQWYINQALQTTLRMTAGGVGYVNDGLMGETVIWYLLNDLKREGLSANATALETAMRKRQAAWSTQAFPCVRPILQHYSWSLPAFSASDPRWPGIRQVRSKSLHLLAITLVSQVRKAYSCGRSTSTTARPLQTA